MDFLVLSVSESRLNVEFLYPAVVTYDGSVRWNTPLILSSSCTLDVTYFPWDEQRCPVEFGSWTFHGNDLDVVNKVGPKVHCGVFVSP
jgi:hypothetical protein